MEKVSNDGLSSRNVTRKLRVVVSLFDHPSKLLKAFETLLQKGFTGADFCVFGVAEAMAMAETTLLNSKLSAEPMMRALFASTKPIATSPPSPAIIASKGKLLKKLNQLINSNQISNSASSYDECRKNALPFISQLRKGSLVLIVGAGQPRQVIHASKALLQCQPDVIQSHEFLMP